MLWIQICKFYPTGWQSNGCLAVAGCSDVRASWFYDPCIWSEEWIAVSLNFLSGKKETVFWPYCCLQEFPWNLNGSHQCVLQSWLLILLDFWVQVFILTRGAVGFIINQVFFNVSKLSVTLKQGMIPFSLWIDVFIYWCSVFSLPFLQMSQNCKGAGKNWFRCLLSLVSFFPFFFYRKTLYLCKGSTLCYALFGIFFPTNRKKCLTLSWEKSRGSSKCYLYK